MPAKFPKGTVLAAVDRSIAAAKHLTPLHSAPVAALRMAAARLDKMAASDWIVEGKLDNVTFPSFLRSCQILGLTPDLTAASKGPAASAAAGGAKPKNDLDAWKQQRGRAAS